MSQNFVSFFWVKFCFPKNHEQHQSIDKKISKKFGKSCQNTLSTVSKVQVEIFFLIDWSENPKYKNSQKNEKILKKTR